MSAPKAKLTTSVLIYFALLLVAVLFLSACASVQVHEGEQTIDDVLAEGARVMWIAAHPDDECFPGPILARASLYYHNPVYMLVLNHGDGGECNLPEGCEPDLATVRNKELKEVAKLYHAELQNEDYYNAALPVKSFPKRHEIAEIWRKHKDPVLVCAEAIRRFKPTVILTFGPNHGATGHPEHQLASRFATAGVRMAADAGVQIGDLPTHRTLNVYYLLNKHWLPRLFGSADPEPFSQIFDSTQPCGNDMSCLDTMAEFTKPHRTQSRDMGAVRKFRGLLKKIYLYNVNPFKEITDPYEAVE